MDEVIVVLTNVPDQALANQMGAAMVEQKLAACVNILGPCTSVYRWQGQVETALEYPLVIKTTRRLYPQVETLIQSRHPYDLPEIIALPVDAGLPAYLDWVVHQVTSEPSP